MAIRFHLSSRWLPAMPSTSQTSPCQVQMAARSGLFWKKSNPPSLIQTLPGVDSRLGSGSSSTRNGSLFCFLAWVPFVVMICVCCPLPPWDSFSRLVGSGSAAAISVELVFANPMVMLRVCLPFGMCR